MINDSDFLLSRDGTKLFFQSWVPKNVSKVLCIVHGLGEHSGRYAHVADYLGKSGIATFMHDLRGHGQSQGKRGHAGRYDLLLSDVEELLKAARAEYTDAPMYLMGHSLGGNIVANYMISMNTNELKGFILSAPWLKLAFDPPAWKSRLGRMVSKAWPSLSQSSNLEVSFLSKAPEVIKAYENDPLVHGMISAGLFTIITERGTLALERAAEISKKGLIYHGNQDGITDWRATEAFAKTHRSSEWHELEGVYHEPHNDWEKDQVMELIGSWLNKY